MIEYFFIDNYSDEKEEKYLVKMTQAFYDYLVEKSIDRSKPEFSYNNVFFRLYLLMPYDFFKFISAEYGATLIAKYNSYVHWYFKTKKEAVNFCQDCNARMRCLIDNQKENKGD